MSRNRIIAIVFGVALALLLFAVFRSCRSGTVPPAERDALDETSYRASHEVLRGKIRGARYEIQGDCHNVSYGEVHESYSGYRNEGASRDVEPGMQA